MHLCSRSISSADSRRVVLQLLVLAAQLVDLLEQVGLPLGEVLLLLLKVRRPLLRLRYRIIESLCP